MKALLGLLAFSTSLEAESASEPAAAPSPPASNEPAPAAGLGHRGQLGLRAALTAGYRMVLRYDESPFCAEPDLGEPASDQQKVCGHGAPPALDLGLSYALADFAEPFLWLRLGLAAEEQTKTKSVTIVGAGVRLYTMSDSRFKIYVEPAVGLELEGGEPEGPWLTNAPEYGRDLVFHVAAGPALDFSRHFGVFLDGGVTVGVLRAVHSSLEIKGGVQLRLP